MLVLCSATAFSQPAPLDETGYASLMADKLRAAFAGVEVRHTAALTLEAVQPDGEGTGPIKLDKLYTFCQRSPAQCEMISTQFITGLKETMEGRLMRLKPAMIRLALADTAQMTGPAPTYSRPLVGNLVIIPVIDMTKTVRPVQPDDLIKLKLTEAQVFAQGELNMRSTLKPLNLVTANGAGTTKAHGVTEIRGESYAASRMILHADWTSTSSALQGQLVVSVPAKDTVLFADGSSAASLQALRQRTRELSGAAGAGAANTLYRWQESGWAPLP